MSHSKATRTGAAVLTSAFVTTLTMSSANAGLKYWTTGGYDADSYVQDGLVLNYDGIRNVGLDKEHSDDNDDMEEPWQWRFHIRFVTQQLGRRAWCVGK
ncbi:MAG: hypothetical protein J6P13_07985 [Kiritimatiellae bacterium]|nr:hypothetical protein [Kiritimatiellia bacterium]